VRQIFLKEVEKRGVDLLDASSGGLTPKQKIDVGPNYQVRLTHYSTLALEVPS
jgi:hypothetical protein